MLNHRHGYRLVAAKLTSQRKPASMIIKDKLSRYERVDNLA